VWNFSKGKGANFIVWTHKIITSVLSQSIFLFSLLVGQACVVRRHSQASGPVLALLFLKRADVSQWHRELIGIMQDI